jgi:hypothetical protein
MYSDKGSWQRLTLVFSSILLMSWFSLKTDDAYTDKYKNYERYVDSLYQINIQIAKDHGRALDTNPNAVRPEPAIWFLDMNGNMYDYPPDVENDSILKSRAAYKKRQDSLAGRQFQELERWYQNRLKIREKSLGLDTIFSK